MTEFRFYFWLFASELWHKKWVFLPLFWLFSCIAILVVFLIPDQYKTRAGIYIDTDQLLAQVVKDNTFVINKSAQSQAEKVRQMIYSTSNLRKVLRAISTDNYNLSPMEEARKLESMRKNLKFGALNPDQRDKDYYVVSYVHSDPMTAYNTLKQILDLFIETNIRQMSSKNDRALAISEDTLKVKQKELAISQAELAKFKQENIQLTEPTNVLLSELQRLEEVIRRYPGRKSIIDAKLVSQTSILAQTPRTIGGGSSTNPVCDFSDIRSQIAGAQSRGLTDLHPDMVYYNDLLKRQQKRCDDARASGSVTRYDEGNINPAYLQLSEQVSILKSDLKILRNDYNTSNARIEEIEDLLSRQPVAMEKLRILEARLEKASDAMKDANSNNDTLQGTIDLSRKSGLISYEVIEEVQVPIIPEKPNRLLLFIGAFLASFIASASFVLVKFKLEKRMSTVTHLREAFDLPVLGSVTAIIKPSDITSRADTFIWSLGLLFLILVYITIIQIVVFSPVKFDMDFFMIFIDKVLRLFI